MGTLLKVGNYTCQQNIHVTVLQLLSPFTNFCMDLSNKKYRSFKSFDEIAFLNDLLAVPWSEIEMFNDIDESLGTWYSLFIKTVDIHAPIKTHRIKNDIQLDWINPDI